MLYRLSIPDFENTAGRVQDIQLTYQIFGQALRQAPVVLVNHSLTGNSSVAGKDGWWNPIVGEGKAIDTKRFSVLAFDMPGNGFGGQLEPLLQHYTEFTLGDLARLQALALEQLQIDQLHAIVGGSIGGALAWELAVLKPKLAVHLVPIATDYRTTDWVLAHCKVQDQILRNSASPVADARMHAMTFYRSPSSLAEKFNRSRNPASGDFEVQRWLTYHGEKLEHRFQKASYLFMNHLLTTIDISHGSGDCVKAANCIEGQIHFVPINSDWFFLAEENWEAYVELSLVKKNIRIKEIKSVHGHDAFLIEHRQLGQILKPVFGQEECEQQEATTNPKLKLKPNPKPNPKPVRF